MKFAKTKKQKEPKSCDLTVQNFLLKIVGEETRLLGNSKRVLIVRKRENKKQKQIKNRQKNVIGYTLSRHWDLY